MKTFKGTFVGRGTPELLESLKVLPNWPMVVFPPGLADLTANRGANLFYAGQASGGLAAPIWRRLELADLPVNLPQSRTVVLCSAFTPSATGVDLAEVPMPYGQDGSSELTWSVNRITLRVRTAGGAPSVRIEKSSGEGVFTPVTLGTVTLADGAYEGNIAGSLGTVQSGDKVRFVALELGTAQNWTLVMEITSQYSIPLVPLTDENGQILTDENGNIIGV